MSPKEAYMFQKTRYRSRLVSCRVVFCYVVLVLAPDPAHGRSAGKTLPIQRRKKAWKNYWGSVLFSFCVLVSAPVRRGV
ncbi:hypothetical protein BJY04DRAFT_200406 [Aspergillus karnatakaensis]|uniref:uncharacterized protein n=1 Tax=Aspergillus karnatakaensis TaxID=1810916 RepID=UPI003CCCA217